MPSPPGGASKPRRHLALLLIAGFAILAAGAGAALFVDDLLKRRGYIGAEPDYLATRIVILEKSGELTFRYEWKSLGPRPNFDRWIYEALPPLRRPRAGAGPDHPDRSAGGAPAFEASRPIPIVHVLVTRITAAPCETAFTREVCHAAELVHHR
jgi:hypothetical protein